MYKGDIIELEVLFKSLHVHICLRNVHENNEHTHTHTLENTPPVLKKYRPLCTRVFRTKTLVVVGLSRGLIILLRYIGIKINHYKEPH